MTSRAPIVSITAAPKITQPVQAVPRSMSVLTSALPAAGHQRGDLLLGLGPVEVAQLLGLAPLGVAHELLDALLEPQVADHDQPRLALVQQLAEVLHVRTRHALPEVAAHAAGVRPDRGAGDQRGRKE